MTKTWPFAGFFIICIGLASRADAQPNGQRLVGPDELGRPIVISAVDGGTLGAFAKAAGVPMGVELAPGAPQRTRRPITLSGMHVDRALKTIAGIDRRYEMRDVDGVFILRTRDAWERADHPLHAAVPAVKLDDIRGRNALSLIATFLGGPQYRETQLGDTKRFSLDLEPGTVLDLMNAAAKAHGELVWSFQTMRGDSQFPYIVTMHSGTSGSGCGVPGIAPVEPVDIASFAEPVVLSDNGSASILDRIVGTKSDGSAIVLNGPYPSAIRDLAKATKVPMGIEFLGPGKRPLTGSIHATGKTLRSVLDAIVAVDSRYEWRELHGVVVVRPATAWNDPEHLFSKLVPAVRLTDVSPQAAVERLAKQLGHPEPLAGIPHGKLLSIDEPPSTVFDLANAILRAHGELTWELSPETHPESIEQGYRYTLTFGVMGGSGLGFAVRP